MAKANVYFKNEEEKAVLIAMRDAFAWDKPPLNNILIIVAGPQKMGKTHLLCSMATEEYGPLYLLDSEFRAHLVANKWNSKTMKNPQGIHVAPIRNYQELVAGVKWIQKNVKPPAVIGLDSGTDIQKFAEEKYLDDAGRERMGMPITYPQMYSYVYAVMDELKQSGFTVVFTSKVKDEFLGDNRTGRKIPRIFQDLPYRADLIIQLEEVEGNVVPRITANGFQLKNDFQLTREMTLPQIIKIAKGE